MKKVYEYWIPDTDDHFESIMSKDVYHEYQRTKRDYAISCVKNFDLALDIGGHIGLWAKPLTKVFKKVITFEPISVNRECLVKNLEGTNSEVIPYALGESSGKIKLSLPSIENTGSYTISDDGIEVEMKKLDDFNFINVGFIKIDVQCMEIPVLKGAINTLKVCNPILCIEQGEREKPAIQFCIDLGYKLVNVIGKEHIFVKN